MDRADDPLIRYNCRMHPLSALEDFESYCRLFTDIALWSPYVQEVCRRHALPCEAVHTGVPGTCPVFLVSAAGARRWVVKFFGRLFDGAQCFAAEREAGRLAGQDARIRTAKLVAAGELGEEGWPWPYLVFEYIPGISLGEVFEQVTLEDRLLAARELGETVRRIHALVLEGSPVFPNTHQPYQRFLEQQRAGVEARHREWDSLPPRLIEQIHDFLPPSEALVDHARAPHLIHADLTRDHLLGRWENGRWTSLALIDFGDARTGDLLYELAALHLDLFAGEPRLLAAFLDAYGLPAAQRADLPRNALATALLHSFNVFAGLPAQVLQAETLAELAQNVWGAAVDLGR